MKEMRIAGREANNLVPLVPTTDTNNNSNANNMGEMFKSAFNSLSSDFKNFITG
jgi:hypothetical protein